jgi:hypothetical protein
MASWEIPMDSSSGKSTRSWLENLLRAPTLAPPAIGPTTMTSADERDGRARDEFTIRLGDGSCQPVLNVVPKTIVGRQLRGLRPAGAPLGVRLRR